MPIRDDLGNRMKNNYEKRAQTYLTRRTPVIIRLDMKAGHTFTRGFNKPFDNIFVQTMQETMQYLCENIQGCLLGYVQSDEISLLLIDYQNLNSDAWFDYRTDKLCSISASMATFQFNKAFNKKVDYEILDWHTTLHPQSMEYQQKMNKYLDTLQNAVERGALFDARCFSIPTSETTNYFYWRQLDATRNSIEAYGQANFSHSELQNKSCNDIQDMLFIQRNINWNDIPTTLKRGSCCIKTEDGWIIDNEIPIFKGEGRNYVEKLVNCND